MNHIDPAMEIPDDIVSNPALLFLYHRIEQILGIKAAPDALVKLNEHIEKSSGLSFVDDPSPYEYILASRERIFEISKLVTINETYFFREGIHFDLLATHFLPQLSKLNRPIRICSAATSIGCEAYSIAMLLDYHAKNGTGFDFEVDAFDVSAEVIETAKNGRYTANTLRADGSGWRNILDLYLVPDGSEYVISHNIREKVRFFPHNIIRGLGRKYDIIFFRNTLIYFSSKNRLIVLNDLAESLFSDGVLFLGISETSSVNHPLLASRFLADAFYFQKVPGGSLSGQFEEKQESIPSAKKKHDAGVKDIHTVQAKPEQPKQAELTVDCGEVMAILETEDGQPNAKKILEDIAAGQIPDGAAMHDGAGLAASVVYFLGVNDFNSADQILSYLEKHNTGTLTRYLRGEYHFLKGNAAEAEKHFEKAAASDKAFWPAFYRISALAAEGNRTRYEYKIQKAIESIELGRELHYECFLGGFSPGYFRRILEKKLT